MLPPKNLRLAVGVPLALIVSLGVVTPGQAKDPKPLGERAYGYIEALTRIENPDGTFTRVLRTQGTIGEVRAVVADHSQLLTHVDRLMNPATAGGALLDLGIYPVAFAWDVLGAPQRFLAAATMTATGVDETTSMPSCAAPRSTVPVASVPM